MGTLTFEVYMSRGSYTYSDEARLRHTPLPTVYPELSRLAKTRRADIKHRDICGCRGFGSAAMPSVFIPQVSYYSGIVAQWKRTSGVLYA